MIHACPQALPSQNPFKWHKADPTFKNTLRTRNLFANPLNTVFNVRSASHQPKSVSKPYVKPTTYRPEGTFITGKSLS